MERVNLAEKLALITEHWRPKVVGERSGQEVKLVKAQGTFVWNHMNTNYLSSATTTFPVLLAAYALGFGATGLTFFDDEVTDFFSPHAAGKSVMFLTALGHPDRVALGLAR